VKTPRELLSLYYQSVGRGASFLLNVPPDRRGILHENDVASLKGLGDLLRATLTDNLAAGVKPSADWEYDLGREVTFNLVRLREDLRLGQRIDALVVERRTTSGWEPFAEATSIGSCRLIRTPDKITARRVRVRIVQAAASPALVDFGLFLEA